MMKGQNMARTRTKKSTKKSTKNDSPFGKVSWYSIDANKMMRTSFTGLKKDLKKEKADFKIFESETGNNIYLKLMNESPSVDKLMSSYVYYQPVRKLSRKPTNLAFEA
jgi:hypothetical protein